MKKRLKLLIATSEDTSETSGVFQVKYGGEFAHRKLIPHLTDYKNAEEQCPMKTREIRRRYQLDFSEDIVGILSFPSVLPELLDDATTYIKSGLPTHDVLLAVGIHPDILIELIKRVAKLGCKAIIILREDPQWINSALVNKLKRMCEDEGLECAFPRPFCSLIQGKTETINRFITQFRIGKPDYDIYFDENEYVSSVDVHCSSPCGATYFVTSGLVGLHKDEVEEVANKLWHTYPCLSSSKMDPEIRDSPLHIAAYINLYAAKGALRCARKEE